MYNKYILSGGQNMRSISFNPLWKLLIDKGMSKGELRDAAELSKGTLARLSKNESVTLETIVKICNVLDCNIVDVVTVLSNHDSTIIPK